VELERVFQRCFARRWRTRLVGGADEPYYQPAAEPGAPHLLHYRLDYFASALHEVAHWCIAGPRRRELPDFGYWYTPDGRSAARQRAFEAVESRPQALEWFFSQACGVHFRVSADNLGAADYAAAGELSFRQRVLEQARLLQAAGLPPRAGLFFRGLADAFATGARAETLRFDMAALQ
jgi:elongation factor P hydroxylase